MKLLSGFSVIALGAATFVSFSPALAQISVNNGVATYTVQDPAAAARVRFNYAAAKALPMPMAPAGGAAAARQPLAYYGPPKFVAGTAGTGVQSPVRLLPAMPEALEQPQSADSPQEFGSQNIPYTTSRLNAYNQPTATFQPFTAAGKLFFTTPQGSSWCTASLIKPGVIVTAAHCVAGFGSGAYYTNFQFVPGYNNGQAPYGTWTHTSVRVLASWLNGTDTCSQTGVVCTNDVATINLYTPNGLPGTQTGTFGYAVDGGGYTTTGVIQVSTLGYPQNLDNGNFMQRTDARGEKGSLQGFQDYVTIMGNLQAGGSSGGPWLINLGRAPILTAGTFGSSAVHNVVVAVTSFGNSTAKRQGASRFTAANFQTLLDQACAANPGKC